MMWSRSKSDIDTKEKIHIFPLSANSNMETGDIPHLSAYYKYLDAAFAEPRIHNMAVTGGFGIGKSSVLQSYEKNIGTNATKAGKNKCPLHFLYISLGSYSDTIYHENMERTSENDGANNDMKSKNGMDHLSAIERRILVQIYSRFHEKDLPSTSFQLIGESIKGLQPISVLCGILTFLILVLIFYKELGDILNLLPLPSWTGTVEPWIHFIIMFIVIVFVACIAYVGCSKLLPRIKINNLSFESDNIKTQMEVQACESYLDLYSMELVYCLEQIADKIGRTVIFEDMDRMPSDICNSVFTSLREINYLINLRLKEDRPMRFIYVINDEVLANMEYSKFFDYVMPIFPVLNEKTSYTIFKQNLELTDKNIITSLGLKQEAEQRYREKYFSMVESDGKESISYIVAPLLNDYRLMYTILNEYSVMLSIYYENHPGNITKEDAVYILAFAIYKNIYAEDYNKIRTHRSRVFHDSTDEISSSDYQDGIIMKLRKAGFLNIRCLYYAGFNETYVSEALKSKLENEQLDVNSKIDLIGMITSEECFKVTGEYCCDLLSSQAFNSYIELIHAIIKCVNRNNYSDTSWFFQDHNVMVCLECLEGLQDDEIKKFFQLSGIDEPQTETVFNDCKAFNPEHISGWTDRRAKIYGMGIKNVKPEVMIRVMKEDGTLQREKLQSYCSYVPKEKD